MDANFGGGMSFISSHNSMISGNTISNSYSGISITWSNNTSIVNNYIMNMQYAAIQDNIAENISVVPAVKTAKPEDTSNWQTYRNEEYGFEIKYPENIVVGQHASNSVLGSADKPIGGIYVGSLVFVILDSDILKKEGIDYFNLYI